MWIAISGKRRSGKSTLANILQQKFGCYAVSLASPLKRLAMEHFDLVYSQVDGELKEVVDPRYDKTPRQIMIDMGKFYRSINPTFWIDRLFQSCSNPCRTYVISDVRFKNELEALKERGALTVRLERDEMLTGKYIDDASETELDSHVGWDLLVPAHENVEISDLYKVANRIKEINVNC